MRLLLDPAAGGANGGGAPAGSPAPSLIPTQTGSGSPPAPGAPPAPDPSLLGEDAVKPAAPPPSGAPDKYDLKLPQGALIDATYAEKIAVISKQQGLSNAQAQAVLDHQAESVKSYVDGQVKQYQERQAAQKAEWLKTLREHPTIGGDKLAENDVLAVRFLQKYGGEKLIKELTDSGYAFYPPLFEAFAKAGRAMQTTPEVVPNAEPGATVSREEALLNFFPSMRPKPQGQTA